MLFLPSAKVDVMSLIQMDMIQWREELVVIEIRRLCT